VLAVGLKQIRHGTLGVKSDVHQIETRQIAQLKTAVKVALRRNIAVLHHDIRWTSGLKSHNSLDFAHKWLAKKKVSGFRDEKISTNQMDPPIALMFLNFP
jgi:hypothetical protein